MQAPEMVFRAPSDRANALMPVDKRFKKGLELFNHQDFFECHEVIEDLWLETPSENTYRNLYKGVIQAAAAVYQFRRGILSGALGLYKTSVGYLEKYKPTALGLDVQNLIDQMNLCFTIFDDWDGQTVLEFPEHLLPRVKYV